MSRPRRDAGRRSRANARGVVWVALSTLLAFIPCSVHAAGFRLGEVSLAVLAGSSHPVPALADYQWDVRPHVAWGAQALAGFGPFAAGFRLWNTGTTQALGLTGQPDPRVRVNSLELLARARVAAWRMFSVHATASGGRLGLRWDPDRIAVETGGTPVEVELAPIHEWVGGAGLALEAPIHGDWSVGLEGERRVYALDTAHRSGSSVVYARERFGDWSARLGVRRAWRR